MPDAHGADAGEPWAIAICVAFASSGPAQAGVSGFPPCFVAHPVHPA
jgi:hypothetical protein